MAIRFTDGREDIWLPVAPQAWLREHWGPAATQEGWAYVSLLCGNVCIMREQIEAEILVGELEALRSFVNAAAIDAELAWLMTDRLDRVILVLRETIASWDGVERISIG